MTSTEEYVNLAQACLREGRFGPLRDIMQSAVLSLGDELAVHPYVDLTRAQRPLVRCIGTKWRLSVQSDLVSIACVDNGEGLGPTYRAAAASLSRDLELKIGALRSHKAHIRASLAVHPPLTDKKEFADDGEA